MSKSYFKVFSLQRLNMSFTFSTRPAACGTCPLVSGIWHRCLLLGIVFAMLLWSSNATPVKRSTFMEDDEDATIRTELVDRNNQTILDMFNLTSAQLSRIAAGNSATNNDAAANSRDSQYFDNIKEHRLNDIKNRLHDVINGGSSEENQERPLHEMAAYPICNSESNESSWLHDNNVTIRFSDSLFEPKRDNLNLDSAILRLYKVNPNGTENPQANINAVNKPKRCIDQPYLDSQIRVTVSIVQQLRRNKRERKKRICNTIMMNSSQTGWVEIDIRRAIYIWESVERQHQQQQQQQQQQIAPNHHHNQHNQQQQGVRQPILVGWLMIEVHDEEERPLKPGLFFKPPKCDQAGLAIPWNYYGPHSSMSSFEAEEVPRSPRLDVKLIGYASFAPRGLHNRPTYDQLRLNLRRQLYRLAQSSPEIIESESTTFTSSADNLLESSVATEVLHRHQKRHSEQHPEQQQHHEQHKQSQQQQQHNHHNQQQHTQQQFEATATSSSDNVDEQHTTTHRQRRHHRRHHRHNHHHHQHQKQQQQHHEQHQPQFTQYEDC